ncbi:MAG: hypothetical protein AAFN40_17645 [Cyanobacteria bacterium J06560_6]
MQNQFRSNSSSRQTQQPSKRSFKNALKAVLRFMVHHPEASARQIHTASKDRYSSKASLYAYLPDGEEQRDWLERIYRS